MTSTLLAVDDERVNLRLISILLKDENYRIVTAENGLKAWKLLEKSPENYDAVLLDRKMPEMSGMEILAKMKAHERLKRIPVIFQTSMVEKEEILEGLRAGVDYYLTKPLGKEILKAIVKTAVTSYATYRSVWKDIRRTTDALALMKTGYFEFRSMKEAQSLTTLLASLCADSGKVSLGLWELLINAVEHGNLGISYEEKSRLVKNEEWSAEVKRRMLLSENTSKVATAQFESSDNEIRFLIRDEGPGFDWQSFMELNPERAFDPNGRGIHLARTLSFDRIEYFGSGNSVLAVIDK